MDNYKDIIQVSGCELARPYINRQVYNKYYDLDIALLIGTLFRELDLVESNNYNEWLYKNPKNRVMAKKECKK